MGMEMVTAGGMTGWRDGGTAALRYISIPQDITYGKNIELWTGRVLLKSAHTLT